MKLTLFLLLAFSFSVSADALGQKVSIHVKNKNMATVLQNIREQSGFAFVYNPNYLTKAKPISLTIENTDIMEVLPMIFADQPFAYTVRDKVITIVPRVEKDHDFDNINNLILALAEVKGKVVDSVGRALEGATVRALDASGKKTTLATTTDRNGQFTLRNVPENALLEISFLGFISKNIVATAELGVLVLHEMPSSLKEVEVVVNTGYQQLPKERATGAFTQVTSEELNLRTGSTLLSRLEDIVPGLQFNRIGGRTQINLRGLSTFSGEAANDVLIILDQFPYEGDLNNINPDDIESITVLKDAAASSIWGAMAGHGVLVINTKRPQKSTKNRPIHVSFSGNVTVSPPVDLTKERYIRSSDFIDLEIDLFNKGYYNSDFANPDQRKKVYSPVISLLEKVKNESIHETEANLLIDQMRNYDYRKELMDHVFRNAVNQQYGMQVTGGTDQASYLVSTGFSTGYNTIKESGNNNRFNLRASNSFKPHRKLTLNSDLIYTLTSNLITDAYSNINNIRPSSSVGGLYPYARLLDDELQPLAIPYRYHTDFVDTAGNGKLLDWTYRPLDISNKSWDKKMVQQHVGVNVSATYELIQGWTAGLTYGHERQLGINESHDSPYTFDMRDRINLFTQFNKGSVVRPIPLGGMYSVDNSGMKSHRFRMQTNLNRSFFDTHEVSVFMGAEASHKNYVINGYKRYGYDNDTYTVASEIDYQNIYPTYGNVDFSQRLAQVYSGMRDDTQRFLSFFGNASYTYAKKYIVSFSARKDAANVFGIKANDRWNPLWSTGISWNASEEEFLKSVSWMDQLKFRITYGHSGKPAHGAAVRPILVIQNSNGHQMYPELSTSFINIPANPRLKWEDVEMTNFAFDFSLFNRKLYGSFDFYLKRSTDIVTNSSLPYVTGRSMLDANVGDMKGHGYEIQLNSTNALGEVKWHKQLSFSFSENKIVRVYVTNPSNSTYVGYGAGNLLPMIGKSLYPVYMFRFAGLDPNTGYPIGYLGDQESTNYSQILAKTTVDESQYHGTLLPPYYGFFRNSFSYQQFDLSFNIAFRLGHVFIRETFDGNITDWTGHDDYYQRWQKPGDEKHTNIPAYIYPEVSGMMNFYTRSSAVVEPGDIIRLREIRLAYQLHPNLTRRMGSSRIHIFANANNIALLWKASRNVNDPENKIPLSPGISVGIQANWN